ncbi:hypothetical protein F2Q69_00017674 [Brassica cretica]|uniref:Uncharacterized protein n=1 Tax=Brassica cretica TaxID=69181 RepID=A0A8S9R4A1_BRACR|nr:hypothetical protein F2Q69_00017674 [Brassica cretica]
MPCFSNGSRLTRYRSEPVVVRRGGPALLTFYTSRTWNVRECIIHRRFLVTIHTQRVISGGGRLVVVIHGGRWLRFVRLFSTLTTRDKEW